jgi:hypothetical protein
MSNRTLIGLIAVILVAIALAWLVFDRPFDFGVSIDR